MHRHAFVTVALLAACGGKQTRSAPDEPPVDAAPAVVVAPEVAELRAKIAATKDDGERLLLHSQLASVLWASSCQAPTEGLCFTFATRTAAPACDGRTEDLVVTPRPVAVLNEIEEVIGELRQLWGDGSALADGADERNRELAAAYAAAMLIPVDQEIEKVLAEPRITGLAFDYWDGFDEASARKLTEWMAKLDQGRDRVFEQLAQVGGDTNLYQWAPAVVVESIALFARMDALLGTRVGELELPNGLGGGVKGTEEYCTEVGMNAGYFHDWAAHGWSQCVQDAESFGVNGPVVDRCKAELEKGSPQ